MNKRMIEAVLAGALLCATPLAANAESVDIHTCLKESRAAAVEMCPDVDMQGESESLTLSGKVDISAGALMKKLGVVDGEFSGDVTKMVEKYQGFQHKDVHEQAIDMRNCRKEVLTFTVDRLCKSE